MPNAEHPRVSIVLTSVADDDHFLVCVPAWDRNRPVALDKAHVPLDLRPHGRSELPKLLMARVNIDAERVSDLRISDVEGSLLVSGDPDVSVRRAISGDIELPAEVRLAS